MEHHLAGTDGLAEVHVQGIDCAVPHKNCVGSLSLGTIGSGVGAGVCVGSGLEASRSS